ncbi:MAG: phosphoribosyltransferase [Armatimonadota bacterium]|nr:phosphoribosyltransferase [bacterium]
MDGCRVKSTPVALRRVVDVDAPCLTDPCDFSHFLGSFWPHSRNSFESRLVKTFKECHPVQRFQPHIGVLCEFYAELVMRTVRAKKIDWIVRVLSSVETVPDATRPLSMLVDTLCTRTGACDLTSVFFKSQARPSMRTVAHLSGPHALKSRIKYVADDLFIKPNNVGGNVLLIDDIGNTGASMRVYADALKQFAGVARVWAVNLAATRFNGGKDGHGMLHLDIGVLQNKPDLLPVWLDADAIYHSTTDCSRIQPPSSCEVKFVAEIKGSPCPLCAAPSKPSRPWWHLW